MQKNKRNKSNVGFSPSKNKNGPKTPVNVRKSISSIQNSS